MWIFPKTPLELIHPVQGSSPSISSALTLSNDLDS